MSSDPFWSQVLHLGQEKLGEFLEVESGSSDGVQAILLINDVLLIQRLKPWLHKRVILQSHCCVSAAFLIYVHLILSNQQIESVSSF